MFRPTAKQMRKEAVRLRKCWVCSNPKCPYPSDEEFREKAKDKLWVTNKDCFIPFETDVGGGHYAV